ncbi:MAG: biotin/lipoyl-binding protein [Acidobacteriota bacterium]|nr:biotin/lipoyl-binding protein [Acidobacteriota bacterium]
MKLQAELDDEKHEISLKQTGGNVAAEIDGRRYELEAHLVEPNVYLLKHENRIYQIFVAPNEKTGEPFLVNSGKNDFEITLTDPKRMRHSAGADENAGGAAEIKTAMPGKVVRVLVEAGAGIQKGDGVLIVEAMKMQNEMKAPKDGTVKEIRVAEGATVNAGDVLAVIE